MSLEIIAHKGKKYPKFQSNGNAARFCMPFAKEVCHGVGLDIGCSKKEWAFSGATPIDIEFDDEYDALNLPDGKFNYIFSSHCLEHLNDWVGVLNYWTRKLKESGILFLYLPDYSQTYWRPWSNRKHVNILTPQYLNDYLASSMRYKHHFVSGVDAYNSFTVIAERNNIEQV